MKQGNAPRITEKRFEKREQIYSNGKYEGTFYNNEKHGRGKFTFCNGDVYDGDYINGKRTGNGIYFWK